MSIELSGPAIPPDGTANGVAATGLAGSRVFE
jgi:hypothetical protein